MKLRILIDSSPCYWEPCGLKRYADCIKKEIGAREYEDMVIDFFPIEHIYHGLKDPDCAKAVKKYFSLKEYFLFNTFSKNKTRIDRINNQLKHINIGNDRVIKKIKREYFRFLNQILEYFGQAGRIRKRILGDYDVVHFLANKIVDGIELDERIIKCVTIHDIIPLVRPDLVGLAKGVASKEIKRFKELTDKDSIFTVSEYSKRDICGFNKNIDPEKVHVTHLAAIKTFRRIDDVNFINVIKDKYKVPLGVSYILSTFTSDLKKNVGGTVGAFRV